MSGEALVDVVDHDERRAVLVTPEGFTIELPLALIIERVMALGLDLTLLVAATAVVILFAFLLGAAGVALGAIALIGLFVVRYGYFVFFELSWQGATPGKRAMGIRVVSRDGVGLGVDAVIARNLLRDLELFLPAVAFLAPRALVGPSPAWMALPAVAWVAVFTALPVLTRTRQRAGDFVGGTLVVRVPRAQLLGDEAAPTSVRTGAYRFTREQLAIYGEHELETLADVLRQAEAGRADTDDLIVVARAIAHKIGYAGDEPRADPLRFLRAFYRAQRDALEKRLLLGQRKASKFD